MHVYCDACGYDSGDAPDTDRLAEKVNADGGKMKMTYDYSVPFVRAGLLIFGNVRRNGWKIFCPRRCDPQYVHLD